MKNEKVEQALDEFAQLIEAELQTPLPNPEPFELYQHMIKAKIFSEANHFREKFVNGYRIIQQEMEKK